MYLRKFHVLFQVVCLLTSENGGRHFFGVHPDSAPYSKRRKQGGTPEEEEEVFLHPAWRGIVGGGGVTACPVKSPLTRLKTAWAEPDSEDDWEILVSRIFKLYFK